MTDDENERSLKLDISTKRSKIYKIFVIFLMVLFNIMMCIIFLKVNYFSLSFLMFIVNLLLILYLNKLRENPFMKKDYIFDLFKKLNISLNSDRNLDETSELSKIINKFFIFEEWLSNNLIKDD